jgi:hypothetical protein
MRISRIALALSLSPLAFMAPAASLVAIPGCGGCSGGGAAAPGLEVTVEDGPGGPALCDATVTASDGTHIESLIQIMPTSGTCAYVGAYERPGVYTIDVASGGRSVTLTDVRVTNGECHVSLTRVTATLPPAT